MPAGNHYVLPAPCLSRTRREVGGARCALPTHGGDLGGGDAPAPSSPCPFGWGRDEEGACRSPTQCSAA
eukprot:7245787-Prymnesium_polylepis.1